MLDSLRSVLPRWRRALRRRRRVLTALLIAALLALVLPTLAPASTRTADVVVAAHDLVAGTVLDAEDLQTVAVALALAPSGATDDPQQLVGRRLPGDVLAGNALSPGALDGTDMRPEVSGKAVMAVPVEAPLRGRLAPGAELALIVSTSTPGTTASVDAVVLEVPTESEGSPGTAAGSAGPHVVVALDPARSGDVAHALHEGWLAVSVIG